jgi:hypothetical protein
MKAIRKYLFTMSVLAMAITGVMAAETSLRGNGGFGVRGFHIDLKAQTMEMLALREMAKELSEMGINALLMEWEAAFPFDDNATICNPYSYTPKEIAGFIDYCSELGVDVIPLQQCFGHIEYILRHQRYANLRENNSPEISQLCPLNPLTAEVFTGIIAEVAAAHPSEYFHIGGDETFLLGQCPECRRFAEEHGKSRLFVDYVVKMCEAVTALGKRPILWADIIIKYPDAVDRLPENTILMDWNYGWDIKHFGDIDKIYASGLEIWSAPALRSDPDTQYFVNWKTHFDNQRDFIPYSREAGYKGIVMTSWSASGLYGIFYEAKNEVSIIDAVRNGYPNSGFRILLAAYAESSRRTEPLNPGEFIARYGRERFGLPTSDAETFRDILYSRQVRIRYGQAGGGRLSLEEVLAQTRRQRDALYVMTPSENGREFEHFRLMWDIRLQYLEFKIIDAIYNSPDFNRGMAAGLLARLESDVMSRTAGLDARYISLNGEFLKPGEPQFQNSLRVRKIDEMYHALKALL